MKFVHFFGGKLNLVLSIIKPIKFLYFRIEVQQSLVAGRPKGQLRIEIQWPLRPQVQGRPQEECPLPFQHQQ